MNFHKVITRFITIKVFLKMNNKQMIIFNLIRNFLNSTKYKILINLC